jgi:hypothetical protein
MQPNNQQGYYQPGQSQPAQPVAGPPPVPTPAPTPVAPVSPLGPPAPVIDPNAMQAALSEPVPTQVPAPAPPQPIPANQSAPQPEIIEDEDGEVDYEDEGELSDEPVSWTAHEFIHREKGTMWFALFFVVIAAFIGISVWTQAWTFTALIIVIAVLVVVYSRRPPRELTYTLNDDGLDIDGKLHKFVDFKSFGIIHDGQEYSVMLIPTQRFQPGISVYFPEEAGEDIVDMLGSRLPMKDLKLDAVDRLVRLLRL